MSKDNFVEDFLDKILGKSEQATNEPIRLANQLVDIAHGLDNVAARCAKLMRG